MKEFVKRMIAEHKELTERIDKLDAYVFSKESDNEEKIDFANMCIQLSAMKKYAEALGARLYNQGIRFNGDEYLEVIEDHTFGSDYDVDKKHIKKPVNE